MNATLKPPKEIVSRTEDSISANRALPITARHVLIEDLLVGLKVILEHQVADETRHKEALDRILWLGRTRTRAH